MLHLIPAWSASSSSLPPLQQFGTPVKYHIAADQMMLLISLFSTHQSTYEAAFHPSESILDVVPNSSLFGESIIILKGMPDA